MSPCSRFAAASPRIARRSRLRSPDMRVSIRAFLNWTMAESGLGLSNRSNRFPSFSAARASFISSSDEMGSVGTGVGTAVTPAGA
eukprot:9471229-Pyramimonas_sp.AAC.1